MEYFSSKAEQVLQSLQTDPAQGLSAAEAARRLEQHGANVLREKKKKTNLQRFLDQFKDVMILILIAAAIVSFVIACVEGNPGEFFEPALILLIVILNAVMGMLQESKAEKALDALKSMSAPHARVLRDGTEQIIDAASLVPGDIIRLEAGDFVPADARLLHSAGLKSEESALTGESVPSEKDAQEPVSADAALGDRVNMVFSGCSVTYGTATAVVTATGMQTEMGKIAGLLSGEEETQTPLQKKLASLGKILGFVALGACAIIFVVGLLNGIDVLEIFMTSVSLAVSAIPEGLPAIVTIVLSIGVQRMVKKNAIIRRLPAVETLGSASVICSDKTGTLTQNRMTLQKAYLDGAADMTLTDDNFATIVDAVREGRGIYANIRKVVGFLLGTNIGEVITVFAAMLLWHRSPLLSMQLLWINLVTDSLPAIALGMEEVEPGVMRQKPKPKDEGIFAHGLGVRVVLQGLMFGILSLAAFWIGWQSTGDLAGGQTLAFMTLALSQVVQAFNMRSDRSLFKTGFFTNRRLNLACLLSVVLVALVLFTPVSIAFGLITLSPQLYLIGLGLSLVPFVVMELSKAFGLIKHQK